MGFEDALIVFLFLYYIFICFIMIRVTILCCFSSKDVKDNDDDIPQDQNCPNEEQMVQINGCPFTLEDDILPPYTPQAPRISTIVYQTCTPLNSPDVVIDIVSLPPPYEEIEQNNIMENVNEINIDIISHNTNDMNNSNI